MTQSQKELIARLQDLLTERNELQKKIDVLIIKLCDLEFKS